MASNIPVSGLHTCWIGNITINYSIDDLQKHFENEAQKLGNLHSVNVTYNTKYNSNQCFINYFNDIDAKRQ